MTLSFPVIRRWRGLGTSGAAAVELAIATPFLVLLIIGVIDFSAWMNSSQAIAAATRIGAEFARDSSTCQSSSTGINYSAPTPTIGTACLTGIANAMQNSFAYATGTLTVNSPTATNLGLVCTCDNGSSIACGDTACPAAIAPKRVYIKVSAAETITPIITWPGFPTTLDGLTEIRLQ